MTLWAREREGGGEEVEVEEGEEEEIRDKGEGVLERKEKQ
jgi:hypothetical protein